MPMGKSAMSCAQLKAEPPYLLRLITKNVAVNSNIVKREKCKYKKKIRNPCFFTGISFDSIHN